MARVVAGVAGGRRLSAPEGRGTRPTSERTREGLFSALSALLGGDPGGPTPLTGYAMLDLYAGSGAVGLEAASRGADPVLLVERDAAALRTIHHNVAELGLPGVAVRGEPVARVLAGTATTRFDVVFCDPPYAQDPTPDLVALVAGGWLDEGSVVVVERASRDPQWQWPEGLEGLRSRRYGDSTLWYGRRS